MSDATESTHDLIYGIDDVPPPGETVFLGLQHFLTMVGATVVIPFVVQQALGFDNMQLGLVIATMFFCSGISTLLQSTLGNRLPIIQGGTFSLLPPLFAVVGFAALTKEGLADAGVAPEDFWRHRMLAVQGAIILGSVVEIIVGYTGLVGRLRKYIGPITIAPTIALIGLALFGVGAPWAGQDWWMGGLTIFLVIIFSQYLRNAHMFFTMFPILAVIVIMWSAAWFGNQMGHYQPGDPGFMNLAIVDNAPWFRVPSPLQWGMPTFGLAAFIGMLAGFVASIVESIGDYYACARLSGAPIPDEKTINKGIGMEGVGSLIAGIFGTGNGTTSYSENIGAIALTRVGARRVIQAAAIILLTLGLFGKFSAVVASIPKPIVGGMFCALFGMITSVGLSNLQFVDLNSARNLFIIGFSFFMGLSLPTYFNASPLVIEGSCSIAGNELLYQSLADIVNAIGKSGMSVGAILAFILDNTVPGSDEERGLVAWLQADSQSDTNTDTVPFLETATDETETE
ncbi:MAG TPA: xanthine permease [Myxococcales bacterium]|nr:xanthine permease [Myxococcales bacterium]